MNDNYDSKEKFLESTELEPITEIEIGEKLVNILSNVLRDAQWDSSLFLRTVKKRLEDVVKEAKTILLSIDDNQKKNVHQELYDGHFIKCKDDHIRVYILLYQIDGSKIVNWQNAIKSLVNYNISRPTYTKEEHVCELIKSKKNFDNHGYVIIDIEKTDFYSQEEPLYDMFNHEMLILKENVLKFQNIRGFVYGLKKIYTYQMGELVYKCDV